jgi:hypothetical protein
MRATFFSTVALAILAAQIQTAPQTSTQQPEKKQSQGTITTTSAQKSSPAFIKEATFALDANAENIFVSRFVILNRAPQPVTGYRLGWVTVFADPLRPPKIQYADSVKLYLPIPPNQKREIGGPLAASEEANNVVNPLTPLIPSDHETKLICYFLADLTFKNAANFHEDANLLAKQERDTYFAQYPN